MSMDDDEPDLGPCCVCETNIGVRNVICVDRRAPIPGTGWGCVECHLPMDGALAVVCDDCVCEPLKFVCKGFVSRLERVPFDSLAPERFYHDESIEH